ncbi:MAG: NADP-dependent phosphogluconate dehydrogenase [Bacteroidota bacterium]
MGTQEFGLIGVGVMGQNLTLNIEHHGHSMAVYDRDTKKVADFLAGKAKGKKIAGAATTEEFVSLLTVPRRIVVLVNAGKPVDDVLASLKPHLSKGDVVIDGGNSFFQDTERRNAELSAMGVHFIGSGVSGGEEGALKGPSLMPGGAREAYDLVAPVLTSIAAHVDGQPCCSYIGPRGAGHYVKMVHNGIEYAIMQLICETYDIMRSRFGFSASRCADEFEKWNATELNSYLFEITVKVLRAMDPETGKPLVEVILDTAEQKGTGKWTSQNAFDLGVPIPTINAAVESRMLSGLKAERIAASPLLRGPSSTAGTGTTDEVLALRDALHASMIASYAQGMALLRAASLEYKYDLHLNEIAALWRGGCIIRAKILAPIMDAFSRNPALVNLMVDSAFAAVLNAKEKGWRATVGLATAGGVPVLAMAASLSYYDGYRAARLPANLLQGQRDFFGAHTYKRLDKEGTFHTHWEG